MEPNGPQLAERLREIIREMGIDPQEFTFEQVDSKRLANQKIIRIVHRNTGKAHECDFDLYKIFGFQSQIAFDETELNKFLDPVRLEDKNICLENIKTLPLETRTEPISKTIESVLPMGFLGSFTYFVIIRVDSVSE